MSTTLDITDMMIRVLRKEVEEYKWSHKLIEAKILEFRNKILLNGGLSDFTILKKYDEHFEIVEA